MWFPSDNAEPIANMAANDYQFNDAVVNDYDWVRKGGLDLVVLQTDLVSSLAAMALDNWTPCLFNDREDKFPVLSSEDYLYTYGWQK